MLLCLCDILILFLCTGSLVPWPMQKHVNSEDVVTVKRVSIPTDSYIAGAGR